MPSSDTQFKPGQSGNPGGRPKNHAREAIFRSLKDDADWDAFVGRIIARARAGDVAAFNAVLDRALGKVPQLSGQSPEHGAQELHITTGVPRPNAD
jgi:hypothetical protein